LVDTKEEVAIKVQRPDMLRSVSLDLHLLHKLAKAMDLFTSVFTEQAPYHDDLVNTFAEGSYLVRLFGNYVYDIKLHTHMQLDTL